MSTCLHSNDVAKLWRVVYQHLRSCGQNHLDAQDSAQEVFHQIMRRQTLKSFVEETRSQTHLNRRLCLAARRVLVDGHRRKTARKRGGTSIETEDSFEDFPSSLPAPDKNLEMKEIRECIESSLVLLGKEMEARGQRKAFDALKPLFQEDTKRPSHAHVARELSKNEANVRVIASRMRRRLRVLAMGAFA